MSLSREEFAALPVEEKRELLRELLRQGAGEPETHPMSFAQQRLWFLHQLNPRGAAYNNHTTVRLSGTLELRSLLGAFAAMARRHDVLRTRFDTHDEEPVQIVLRKLSLAVPVIDLRQLDEPRREREGRRLAVEQARYPFDLKAPPLLRVRLIQLDAQSWIMALTIHHIISDAWSMRIFIRELAKFYEATIELRTPPLARLPIRYVDYARWQRDLLKGEFLASRLRYWKEKLSGLRTLELPTDRPRPGVSSTRGRAISYRLAQPLLAAVKALGHSEGSTLFMVLLAVFQTLLGRWSASQDIAVGSPVANRDRLELEGLIGVLINTLVLRAEVSRKVTFRELLLQVRRATLEAYENQALPFEYLVEELRPERDLSHSPLFQVMFQLEQARDLEGIQPAGLTLAPIRMSQRTANFDLTLVAIESQVSLVLELEYQIRLFDSTTVTRWLRHFESVLEEAMSHPERALMDLRLLSFAERHQVAEEWNDTALSAGLAAPCLHHPIEAQVKRTPDAPAVGFEGTWWSYRELEERANRLARHLRGSGVGADVLVGVFLERSAELVMALLGILKAGGAYVPLDPRSPRERLAFMVDDSRLCVVVTQERFLPSFPDDENVTLLCLDRDGPEISARSGDRLAAAAAADHLAYVIYTSGSTGRPKGAMNTHRAIVNRLLWMQSAYALGPSDRVLQKTPFGFDVSVWELFWPLWAGAGMVVARPGGHRDPSYLAELIEGEQVTTLHFVPSMLRPFLDEAPLEKCRSLCRVVASGEALPTDLAQQLASCLGADLHNLYGPTEAAVDVTFWKCRDDVGLTVPIGRPVSNCRIHLLDRCFHAAPAGVPGQLHIAGVALARGYLARPALTAEKFIPHPFATAAGDRLYATGDLARHLADGRIEFLGRLDDQVKIRGIRIELGEIEAELRQAPRVRECVVLAREDVPGEKRLVAYLVVDSALPALEELRRLLREKLPEAMIPSAFVVLDELPLLPNGKLDRRSLEPPTAERPRLEAAFVEPKTRLERRIAEVWCSVLGLEKVGVHDNFFDLGGHSLLLLKVAGRLRELLDEEQPVVELFRYPSISALAGHLRQKQQAERAPVERPARREELDAGRLRRQQRLARRQSLRRNMRSRG